MILSKILPAETEHFRVRVRCNQPFILALLSLKCQLVTIQDLRYAYIKSREDLISCMSPTYSTHQERPAVAPFCTLYACPHPYYTPKAFQYLTDKKIVCRMHSIYSTTRSGSGLTTIVGSSTSIRLSYSLNLSTSLKSIALTSSPLRILPI